MQPKRSAIHIFNSLLLALMLLVPSLVKLEHHHDTFQCNAQNQKHLHQQYDKCEICNFEFAAFAVADELKLSEYLPFVDRFSCNYTNPFVLYNSSFSFRLRGPPALLV